MQCRYERHGCGAVYNCCTRFAAVCCTLFPSALVPTHLPPFWPRNAAWSTIACTLSGQFLMSGTGCVGGLQVTLKLIFLVGSWQSAAEHKAKGNEFFQKEKFEEVHHSSSLCLSRSRPLACVLFRPISFHSKYRWSTESRSCTFCFCSPSTIASQSYSKPVFLYRASSCEHVYSVCIVFVYTYVGFSCFTSTFVRTDGCLGVATDVVVQYFVGLQV